MENEVVAALLGSLGGLVSGAIAAWATIRAKRLDHIIEELKLWVSAYETKLLEQRLVEYRGLWKLTESSSRRRVAELTPEAASALAERLTEWYYRQGGIVLSEDARDRFFSARNSLELFPAGGTKHWHTRIVEEFSALRTALCEDINSRRGPRLRSNQESDFGASSILESAAGGDYGT